MVNFIEKLKAFYKKYILKFKFEAGTSRGILKERTTYFIHIQDNGIEGIGEISPLFGLSIDFIKNIESIIIDKLNLLSNSNTIPTSFNEISSLLDSLDLDKYPSIRFGFETALLDLINGGKRIIFETNFLKGQPIEINGLIWMGTNEFMLEQLNSKLEQGFKCIKMKIGAINFEDELEILKFIRTNFSPKQIELRVDANGAFTHDDVKFKLEQLSKLKIHSIEQPIMPKQWKLLEELCTNSPIDIALDEELIGIIDRNDKADLLNKIKPKYIILKPTLLGGFKHTKEWIELAEERNIGWWMTSALESNIGLNAICQFASTFDLQLPQGLGTGGLYHNNIEMPLIVENGEIKWENE